MKNVTCRYRNSGFFTTAFSVFLAVVFIAGSYAVCQASNMTLDYRAGKLSANVSGVPIQKVLKILSAKSGITVFLDNSLKSKRISARFENLTLEEGIKRLVKPYSSAMVFGKRTTADGRRVFYVSEVKVFDSSNKKATFELVGKKMSGTNSIKSKATWENRRTGSTVKFASVPPAIKDPARAAAFKKKVSASVLRTRIVQKKAALRRLEQKMRHEEEQKIRKIQQLETQLKTASDSELNRIQANISMLSADLNNFRQRSAGELKKLQREHDQLRNEQLKYGASLGGSSL